MKNPKPFAGHGTEKMIYDIRMGPQCVFHRQIFFSVYLADPRGGKGRPHIIRRDPGGHWSAPVLLGEVDVYDPHFAPILWIDTREHLHVLYHCHIYLNTSRHLVSARPMCIDAWRDAALPAPSMSYPRLLHRRDGGLLLFYRALGHMGFWTYVSSEDGGCAWSHPEPALVDFDHLPVVPGDDLAGTYHSARMGRDGKHLHLAFVDWDEQGRADPFYGCKLGNLNRRHLFYLRVDTDTGRLFTHQGEELPRPLNRSSAAVCRVWDTGHRLTNMPSLFLDQQDQPSFVVPVTGETLLQCGFTFIEYRGGEWTRHSICETSSLWNAAHHEISDEGRITVFLVASPPEPRLLPFGGGRLQEWISWDQGKTWTCENELTPGEGMLCNNPQPVQDREGNDLPRCLQFFAWPGPEAIDQVPDGGQVRGTFTGQAYLWREGQWL